MYTEVGVCVQLKCIAGVLQLYKNGFALKILQKWRHSCKSALGELGRQIGKGMEKLPHLLFHLDDILF